LKYLLKCIFVSGVPLTTLQGEIVEVFEAVRVAMEELGYKAFADLFIPTL